MSFENMFEYTPLQFELVLAVLSLTAAVFAAALFYYLLTARSITPRLRIPSYLSAVAMVSADRQELAEDEGRWEEPTA